MTKTPSSKETKVQPESGKPSADELRDEDLQEVVGGLAANTPAAAPIVAVCVSKL